MSRLRVTQWVTTPRCRTIGTRRYAGVSAFLQSKALQSLETCHGPARAITPVHGRDSPLDVESVLKLMRLDVILQHQITEIKLLSSS
jgi:hypothetical protein